jgi:hypothetical protein
MATSKGTINVDLEYEVRGSPDGDEYIVAFSHPDLKNQLFFSASSLKLVNLQLKDLNTDKETDMDPVGKLLKSAERLVTGITDAKKALRK